MEWIAGLIILWIISSFLYHKPLAKDSKRFYESDLPIEPNPTIVDDISAIIDHKPLAKDNKKWYDSDLPITGHPTIVDDILGHCVLPPIVEPKKPLKPLKRRVDKSVNPFDEQYEIAEPIKRSFNQFMSAQDKKNYMHSFKWYQLRSAVFERDSYTCQSCGSKHNLRCHHIDYSMLGDEPLHHLTTLCDTCHTNLHKQLGYDRLTIYNIKDNS